MNRHYSRPDDYMMRYRNNDYEPLQLNVQKKPDTVIEFVFWVIWSFVKHLMIR